MIQDQSGKEQSKTAKKQQEEPLAEQINKFLVQNRREEQSRNEGTQMKKVELQVPQNILASPKFYDDMTEKKAPQLVGQPGRVNMDLFKKKPKRPFRDLPITNFGSTDDDVLNSQFRNQRPSIQHQDDRLERTINNMPQREKTFLQAKEDREQFHHLQVFTEDQTFQNPHHVMVKGQSEADDDNDSEDKEIVHAQDKLGVMNSEVIYHFLKPGGQGYPQNGVKNWHQKFNDWALV
ncbi:hypothetical protein pb186bvf_004873 [Paramecium bursaria]